VGAAANASPSTPSTNHPSLNVSRKAWTSVAVTAGLASPSGWIATSPQAPSVERARNPTASVNTLRTGSGPARRDLA
jgi:hypothetical protein